MNRSRTKLRLAIGGAVAAGIGLVQAASGQDGAGEPAGLRVTLDYSLGIDIDSNYDLDDPSPGTYSALVNGFDFAILSNTRNQSFALRFGSEFRLQDDPGDPDTVFDWTYPSFAVLYTRESSNARLALNADATVRDVDDSEPFFIDTDGDTIIDERGFDDGGTVTQAGVGVTLETGINDPIGTTYSAAYQSRTYSDTEDPGVYDREEVTFSTSTHLRFSQTMTGYVDLSAGRYVYTGGRDTVGTDLSAQFGLVADLSPTLSGEIFLGYGKTHEEEEVGGQTVETVDQGPLGSLGLTRALTNGTIYANYSRDMVEDTFRNTLTFGRTISLASYELTAELGMTNLDGGDPLPTFGIYYAKPLADGQLNASFSRSVTVNTDDEERTLTSAVVGYTREINELSSISLGFDYALIGVTEDADGDDGDETWATLTATYTHALNRDWNMSVGYRGRSQSDDFEDAISNAVFVNVGRRFTLR